MPDLSHWPLVANLALFAAAASMVWIAGARLAVLGDELSERWRLEKEFVGLIFLATVSKFPEIVISIFGAQIDNPGLVLGGLFGSVPFNTAILAVADFLVVRGALTSWPRSPSNAMTAVMLIVLLSAMLLLTITGDIAPLGHVGLGGLALAALFPVVIGMQRAFNARATWAPVDLPEETERGLMIRDRRAIEAQSTTRILAMTGLYSLAILLGGLVLTLSADALSGQTGMDSSLVGVTLVAAATSLPELSTTIASVRIGAYTMALANIFGSNLITMALIPPADMAYEKGPILNEAGAGVQVSLAIGIMVTAIYVAGILIRRTPAFLGAGLDSWLVAGLYLASLALLFGLG